MGGDYPTEAEIETHLYKCVSEFMKGDRNENTRYHETLEWQKADK
ncbi:hypothetical protein Desor_1405 [Desulfosporosinus orientis DSM 765]|uniref:Uncharacterized protein n=1 Tax=Desulfosporosinus orientis (strain ATCC 19365 / DSM 765 / NCIMB 8382 / VKM B-1628 / Singapore I) TaxID=768706 RepID=G7W8C3_DESOD|nr:hypothetical protein Desor_1405 [Desulfosporosinus orientis DSM 765]